MKTLITITTFISVLSINVFAGTLGGSDGSTKNNNAFVIQSYEFSKSLGTPKFGNTIQMDPTKIEKIDAIVKSMDSQVYYMGENETEVQFATNVKGSRKVEIHSLKPEMIQNNMVVESLRKSQMQREWVLVPTKEASDKKVHPKFEMSPALKELISAPPEEF